MNRMQAEKLARKIRKHYPGVRAEIRCAPRAPWQTLEQGKDNCAVFVTNPKIGPAGNMLLYPHRRYIERCTRKYADPPKETSGRRRRWAPEKEEDTTKEV